MTPILLLVYNRPDHTKTVLDKLLSLGVKSIYVSSDGPKNGKDALLCQKVEAVISESRIEVIEQRSSKKNLGCKNSVIDGITWFFTLVECGIILEDDCLPSVGFIPFCTQLLEKYGREKKVKMISGNNPLGSWYTGHSHHFSRIGHIWGWATWRDRWQSFNPNLPNFKEFVQNSGFERIFGPTSVARSRRDLTERSLNGDIDTWDYQWNCHINMQKGLTVVPAQNLITNIGFDDSGTNTDSTPRWIVNTTIGHKLEIDEPLVVHDAEYEMEVHLAQLSSMPRKRSSNWFRKIGNENKGNRLKILQINSTDEGGGAEKIAVSNHLNLLDLGHDSRLLVQTKKGNSETVFKITDELHAHVQEFKPDVIHVHNLHGTSISLWEVTDVSHTTPMLFTLHDSWLCTGSATHPFVIDTLDLIFLKIKAWNREFEARTELLMESQVRFTSPSQWMRQLFENRHPLRSYYVPNGFETAHLGELKPPSKRYILFIGNRPKTNLYKDYHTLKKGWEMANNNLKEEGVDLIVLGGSSFQENVSGRTEFGIPKQPQEIVATFIEHALFVVQASKQDNAPLTILEAHQQNKMVLGSLVGGIPEMLNDFEREHLCPVGNHIQMANSIQHLVRSQKTETVDKNLTWEHHERMAATQTYLGHYLDMVNG